MYCVHDVLWLSKGASPVLRSALRSIIYLEQLRRLFRVLPTVRPLRGYPKARFPSGLSRFLFDLPKVTVVFWRARKQRFTQHTHMKRISLMHERETLLREYTLAMLLSTALYMVGRLHIDVQIYYGDCSLRAQDQCSVGDG